MKNRAALRFMLAVAAVPLMLVQGGLGWGANGHRMINRLATENLPKDMPEFLRSPAAVDAMVYYAPVPDRYRSSGEPELSAAIAPEHFMDMEYADLVGPTLPRKRYDFIRALAYAQKAHPDLPLSEEKVGLQPYAATEAWEKVKNAMRDYREAVKEHKDTKPVEAQILFEAGMLGHYVGDGSQPLHTTFQYNGWTGDNPHGYTTLHTVHSQFETAFVNANVDAKKDLQPLIPGKAQVIDDVFAQYVAYLRHTGSLVEKTYQLEKAGGFTGAGSAESRAFVDERLAAGATELRDLMYTAWVRSADYVKTYQENPPVKKGLE